MPYLKHFAALVFVLTLCAPAAQAADEVMGPPWPPPIAATSENVQPMPTLPPDYPEDFSKPDVPVRTAVHNAFGEEEDIRTPPRTAWGGEPQVSE